MIPSNSQSTQNLTLIARLVNKLKNSYSNLSEIVSGIEDDVAETNDKLEETRAEIYGGVMENEPYMSRGENEIYYLFESPVELIKIETEFLGGEDVTTTLEFINDDEQSAFIEVTLPASGKNTYCINAANGMVVGTNLADFLIPSTGTLPWNGTKISTIVLDSTGLDQEEVLLTFYYK